jgi:hypothetical protein
MQDELFLIRIIQNRKTLENERILDEIQEERCEGRVEVTIPRDSRNGMPEREAVLQVRHASYSVERSQILERVRDREAAGAEHR